MKDSITYSVRTDTISDENNISHTVYGIDVYRNGQIIKSIPNICCDYDAMANLAILWNSMDVDVTHINDVIEDSIN